MQIASTEGFGPRKDGEDQFDTAIGLLDMILEGGVEQISFFGRVVELCAMVDSHSKNNCDRLPNSLGADRRDRIALQRRRLGVQGDCSIRHSLRTKKQVSAVPVPDRIQAGSLGGGVYS